MQMAKIKNKSVAILFSGGTDSTLTSALLTEQFDEIHLLTYDRFGFHSTDNTNEQFKLLAEKYVNIKFVHKILNIDKIFKHITYDDYFNNLKNFGFFNLSTCGLCKLSMHVKTVDYCLENNIKTVADGANKAMFMFPDQMKPVIDVFKSLYHEHGIEYINPVFNIDAPEEKDFLEKEDLHFLKADNKDHDEINDESSDTTGLRLYQLGLAPSPNVKGSHYDKKRQPRCFQFVLFNIFAKKYYMEGHTYEEYLNRSVSFYSSKVLAAKKLLANRLSKKKRQVFSNDK